VVIITKYGRDSLVVITAEEWERLKWARQERGSTVELTKEQMEAIRTARGSEEFAHVDAELK
jgi:PHD/YefM family antitoxin component YafN of YafNO toxin-antitoxin module